jgi:CRP-like cAMP-binding protein
MPGNAQAARRLGGACEERTAPVPARHALDRFEQFACTISVRRAQAICRQGDQTDFCWRVLTGCVRTVAWLGGGDRQIGEFLWPGALLGIDVAGVRCFDTEAVTDVTLRRYPRCMIEAAAESDPGLASWLRGLVAGDLSSARKHIFLLGRKTAMQKITAFLLGLDCRSALSHGRVVELPMSRTDVADHLGMSIETVCRNLALLEREGTVAILRRGIELRDREALQRLAYD